jgi:DNA-binding NarL/FixJ family response regulator
MKPPKGCANCAKKEKCTTPCSRVDKFADQDAVPQKEKPIGIPVYGSKITEISAPDFLTFRQRQIFHLWIGGFSRREICKSLKITAGSLRFQLFQINQKIKYKPLPKKTKN